MKKNTTNILFAGDYHVYGRFDKFITKNPDHNLFDKKIKTLVSDNDLSVFNLEDPITNSKEGCFKNGPYGVGSKESLKPVGGVGFNVATFATNHTYDMKNTGIADTIQACNKQNIQILGAGLSEREAREFYCNKIGDHQIAILNFSRLEFNEATEDHGGANPLNVINNVKDIRSAKKKADLVIVVVHEGVDVFHLPSPKLVKQMRFYVDNGADAVIIHHSRLISGYEIYNGKPIFYGLGNLLHLAKNRDEHVGLLVQLTLISENKINFELIPVELNSEAVVVSACHDNKKQQVLEKVEKLSEIIRNEDRLKRRWLAHVGENKILYLSIFAGHPRLFFRIAKKFSLLTIYEKILLINKRKYLSRWGIIKCQSHREAADAVFTEVFK